MLQTLHKPYITPYTKLYIEAFKTLHKYYTRKPIVIHAECAFGAAVAALSRHQVIFSRRPVTPARRRENA